MLWESFNRRNRRFGFTLIEMMVVVVILGICAAVIIPMAMDSSSAQAKAAARMLSADIQYAQSAAITYQMPITMAFSTANESYTLKDPNGTTLTHPVQRSAYAVDFGSQSGMSEVEIISASFTGASVTFDEMGTPTGQGTVRLQAGSYIYDITVAAATGRVTVATVGS